MRVGRVTHADALVEVLWCVRKRVAPRGGDAALVTVQASAASCGGGAS